MLLVEALGVGRGDVVSLVGGGGKTSLGLRLVSEAAALGWRAVFTVTTKIYPPPIPVYDRVSVLRFEGGPVCLAGPLLADGKLSGISISDVAVLRDLVDLVVVEADGSAGRPLKFPLAHEPVIPPCSTVVVPVAGASVVGQPLVSDWVHRSEAAAAFVDAVVATPAAVAMILWHRDGATRGRPAGARVVPVINQADSDERLAAAREVAASLVSLGAPVVLLTSAQSDPPVVARVCREGL